MGSINHDLKIIFIHTPKCGGIYISTILEKFYGFKPLVSSNLFDNSTDNIVDKLDKIMTNESGSVIKYVTNNMDEKSNNSFNDYFKFTFVRNPYTKFVSAINYCCEGFIKTNKKNNIPIESLKELNIKLFLENYYNNNYDIINSYIKFHVITSQSEHLLFNDIKYDFIGKFENLDYDLIQIFKKLNIKIIHQRYILNNIVINSSRFSIKNNINIETLNQINDIFSNDFTNFNYSKVENIDEYDLLMANKTDLKESRLKLIDELIEEGTIESPYNKTITDNGVFINILKSEYQKQDYDSIGIYDYYLNKNINKNIANKLASSFKNLNFSSFKQYSNHKFNTNK
jgi:hypothetical protein